MLCNSDLIVQFVGNSHLVDDNHSDEVNNKLHSNLTSKCDSPRSGQYNFLRNFWKRLTLRPSSFPQNQNASIINIVDEEIGTLASESIKTVLANHLDLPINSKKLSEVINDSFKIFHEDFPCDFILEFQGERLGMMMLDRCSNSTGEETLV